MSQFPPQGTPFSQPENPYASTLQSSAPSSEVGAAFRPLYERKSMISLIGVLLIIGGALYCLTIIGAIIGIPFIIMGLALRSAATNLTQGAETQETGAFHQASTEIAKFFFIAGIIAIIGIVFNILYFGFIIVAIVFGGF